MLPRVASCTQSWSANKGPVLGTLVSEVKIHTTFIGGKKRFRSREIYQRGEE